MENLNQFYLQIISIMFTNSNLADFKNDIKIEFKSFSKWFKASRLPLNFYKINFMQFTTKNSPQIDLDIGYANKLISKAYDTKLVGVYVDSTLSWKNHVEQITHKLSLACYTVRSVKPFVLQESLKVFCYACFHSIMNYGLIFWWNSSHSENIFKIQQKIISIITRCRSRDSCRDLSTNQKILLFQLQYILTHPLLVVNNKNIFKLNSDVCHINTRQNFHQH